MMSNKNSDLGKHKAEIKKYLEEEIVSRYYFYKGRIEYALTNDDDVKEAIRLLSDLTKIKILLTSSDNASKPFNVSKKF